MPLRPFLGALPCPFVTYTQAAPRMYGPRVDRRSEQVTLPRRADTRVRETNLAAGQSSILAAAVGAALALAACTPQRQAADGSRPASSASPQGAGVYGSGGGGAAGTAAGAQRRNEDDSDAEARGSTTGESGDSGHGGFGDSGTAGASG
jgi:hypothetical protein